MPERSRPAWLYATPAFEPHLLEFSIALVDEEKIGDRVVRDEKVHPAVVVDVRRNDTPRFSQRLGDAGFLADVGEGAVRVVVEEPARGGRIDARNAIEALSGFLITAEFVLGLVKVHGNGKTNKSSRPSLS